MKDSKIIEEGLTQNVFEKPSERYTKDLIKSSFI
jgi:ABC-type microcin C transport system duplicated ATPase subunit YejF